jgi:PPOX class probable F420-dependent enzyme
VLATYRRDGRVLLSPVWHQWRDGGFDVVTSSDGAKTQQLRRDAHASLVVYEHEFPYRGIEVSGEARLQTDGVEAAARQIATRYIGAEGGAAYAERMRDDVVIRLEPGRVRAWDFADEGE